MSKFQCARAAVTIGVQEYRKMRQYEKMIAKSQAHLDSIPPTYRVVVYS